MIEKKKKISSIIFGDAVLFVNSSGIDITTM